MSNVSCPCCMKSIAISYSNDILHELCENNRFIEMCKLIEAGENVNGISYPTYSTPLHIAAKSGSMESVIVLLSHGAIPDIFNREKHIPLHIAVQQNNLEIAKILLESGSSSCECSACQEAIEVIIQGGEEDLDMDFEKHLENLRPVLQGKIVNKFGDVVDINK